MTTAPKHIVPTRTREGRDPDRMQGTSVTVPMKAFHPQVCATCGGDVKPGGRFYRNRLTMAVRCPRCAFTPWG